MVICYICVSLTPAAMHSQLRVMRRVASSHDYSLHVPYAECVLLRPAVPSAETERYREGDESSVRPKYSHHVQLTKKGTAAVKLHYSCMYCC